MEGLFRALTPVLLIVLVGVVLFGLFNMMRGGSPNLSQKLMRARVLIQFAALVIMMTALYLSYD